MKCMRELRLCPFSTATKRKTSTPDEYFAFLTHRRPPRRSEFDTGQATPACSNMIERDMDASACLNFMKSNGGMENVDPLQVRTQPPQPRRIRDDPPHAPSRHL